MLIEGLALDLSQLKFLGSRLPGAISAREGASTPRGATADLSQVREDGEGLGITQRDVDHTLVHPGAERLESGCFLATACGSGGDKETEVFAMETTRLPQATEAIDEGLPLSTVVGIAGGNAKQEGIVLSEDLRGNEGDGSVLLWGIHLLQDFGWEGLFDSVRGNDFVRFARSKDYLGTLSVNILVDIGLSASGLNTLLLSSCQLGNMAPG